MRHPGAQPRKMRRQSETENKVTDHNACQLTKAGNIITPKARMSFPNLFVAKAFEAGDKPKYNLSLLIPPGSDLSLLEKAAADAAGEEWGSTIPKGLKSPFLDAGSKESTAQFEGWTLIRVSAISKPGIVGPSAKNVTDESEVYAGRWCVASLRPFCYEFKGSKGVSFGLQNVQLLDHDEPIGGRARAEDEFSPVPGAVAAVKGGASADAVFG